MLALDIGQEFQGVDYGLTGRGGVEGDRAEHVGPEPADSAVLLHQLGVIAVVGRSGQCPDAGDRLGQGLSGHAGEDGRAEPGIAAGVIEQDRACLAELQGGGIQVVERAEPFLPSGPPDLERQLGDQGIEDVEGVVQRRGLEDAGEG
jgi:hypothetical protein